MGRPRCDYARESAPDPAELVEKAERLRNKYPTNSYDRGGLRPRSRQDTPAAQVALRSQLSWRAQHNSPPVTLAGQPRAQEP